MSPSHAARHSLRRRRKRHNTPNRKWRNSPYRRRPARVQRHTAHAKRYYGGRRSTTTSEMAKARGVLSRVFADIGREVQRVQRQRRSRCAHRHHPKQQRTRVGGGMLVKSLLGSVLPKGYAGDDAKKTSKSRRSSHTKTSAKQAQPYSPVPTAHDDLKALVGRGKLRDQLFADVLAVQREVEQSGDFYPDTIASLDDYRKWLNVKQAYAELDDGQQVMVNAKLDALRTLCCNSLPEEERNAWLNATPAEKPAQADFGVVPLGIDADPDAATAAANAVGNETKTTTNEAERKVRAEDDPGQMQQKQYVADVNRELATFTDELKSTYKSHALMEADQRQLLMLLCGDIEAELFVDPVSGDLRTPEQIIEQTLFLLKPYKHGNSVFGEILARINHLVNVVAKFSWSVIVTVALVATMGAILSVVGYVVVSTFHAGAQGFLGKAMGTLLATLLTMLKGVCGALARMLFGKALKHTPFAFLNNKMSLSQLMQNKSFQDVVTMCNVFGLVAMFRAFAQHANFEHEHKTVNGIEYALQLIDDQIAKQNMISYLAQIEPDAFGLSSDLASGISTGQMHTLVGVQKQLKELDDKVEAMNRRKLNDIILKYKDHHKPFASEHSHAKGDITMKQLHLGIEMQTTYQMSITNDDQNPTAYRQKLMQMFPELMRSFHFLDAYGHPRTVTDICKTFYVYWEQVYAHSGASSRLPTVPYTDHSWRDYLGLTPLSQLRRMRKSFKSNPLTAHASKWWRTHPFLYNRDKTPIPLNEVLLKEPSVNITGLTEDQQLQLRKYRAKGWAHRINKFSTAALVERFHLSLGLLEKKYDLVTRAEETNRRIALQRTEGVKGVEFIADTAGMGSGRGLDARSVVPRLRAFGHSGDGGDGGDGSDDGGDGGRTECVRILGRYIHDVFKAMKDGGGDYSEAVGVLYKELIDKGKEKHDGDEFYFFREIMDKFIPLLGEDEAKATLYSVGETSTTSVAVTADPSSSTTTTTKATGGRGCVVSHRITSQRRRNPHTRKSARHKLTRRAYRQPHHHRSLRRRWRRSCRGGTKGKGKVKGTGSPKGSDKRTERHIAQIAETIYELPQSVVNCQNAFNDDSRVWRNTLEQWKRNSSSRGTYTNEWKRMVQFARNLVGQRQNKDAFGLLLHMAICQVYLEHRGDFGGKSPEMLNSFDAGPDFGHNTINDYTKVLSLETALVASLPDMSPVVGDDVHEEKSSDNVFNITYDENKGICYSGDLYGAGVCNIHYPGGIVHQLKRKTETDTSSSSSAGVGVPPLLSAAATKGEPNSATKKNADAEAAEKGYYKAILIKLNRFNQSIIKLSEEKLFEKQQNEKQQNKQLSICHETTEMTELKFKSGYDKLIVKYDKTNKNNNRLFKLITSYKNEIDIATAVREYEDGAGAGAGDAKKAKPDAKAKQDAEAKAKAMQDAEAKAKAMQDAEAKAKAKAKQDAEAKEKQEAKATKEADAKAKQEAEAKKPEQEQEQEAAEEWVVTEDIYNYIYEMIKTDQDSDTFFARQNIYSATSFYDICYSFIDYLKKLQQNNNTIKVNNSSSWETMLKQKIGDSYDWDHKKIDLEKLNELHAAIHSIQVHPPQAKTMQQLSTGAAGAGTGAVKVEEKQASALMNAANEAAVKSNHTEAKSKVEQGAAALSDYGSSTDNSSSSTDDSSSRIDADQ